MTADASSSPVVQQPDSQLHAATERISTAPIMPGPVAYLTGSYPKASHTFIQREVAALRAEGVEVLTFSVRRSSAADLSGPAQHAESAETFAILETARAPLRLLMTQLTGFLQAPRRSVSALRLALSTRPPGWKGLLWQLFYLAEANILAVQLRRRDVVHLHNHFGDSSCTVAMLASTLTGIPYSYTEHGPTVFYAPHYWRLDVKAARARFVACISHYCRAQVMLFSDQVHWERLKLVRCGIEPERYDAAARADQPCDRILFIGRLAAVKGVVLLLQAFSELRQRHPGLSLMLVGDGPERDTLHKQAAAMGLSGVVEFAGQLGEDEVAEALAGADMLVLPSFAEGVPVVLMEAMASRLPVIATRVGGVAELVEDGVNGLLVAPGDVAGLICAMERLLRDPDLRRRMGQAGRAVVESRHDVRSEARRLLALFQAAANPQR